MLDKTSVNAFSSLVEFPSNIVIITHIFPDADALGSSLGLSGFLKSLNHKVSIIIPNTCPEYLKWLPGIDTVISADSNLELSSKLIKSAELIIILDLSQRQRMGNYISELIDTSTVKKIVMDHHPLPQDFADIYFHDTQASAAAEIVFMLICALGKKHCITKTVAECLYAALVSDTGSFRHPSTTSNSHRVVAELIDLGANVSNVTEYIQDSNSVNKIKFLGYVVSNCLTIFNEYGAAYVTINENDLFQFGLKYEDTESILPQIMSIRDINITILVKQMKDVTKLSLRSKGTICVNEIAIKYFNGGGHKNAAGGTFSGSIEELFSTIQEVLKKEVQSKLKRSEPAKTPISFSESQQIAALY